MGQLLSDTRAKNAHNEQLCNDSLNMLVAAAKDKLKLFERTVLDRHGGDDIKIDKILYRTTLIRAGVSEDSKETEEAVNELISDVADEAFTKAISVCAMSIIKNLLGNYSGNESEHDVYKIVVGPLGGVYRLDFYLYSYKFTSQSLMEITKNVLAVIMIISSANLDGVNDNTLRDILQLSYGKLGKDKCMELYDMLKKGVADVQSCKYGGQILTQRYLETQSQKPRSRSRAHESRSRSRSGSRPRSCEFLISYKTADVTDNPTDHDINSEYTDIKVGDVELAAASKSDLMCA